MNYFAYEHINQYFANGHVLHKHILCIGTQTHFAHGLVLAQDIFLHRSTHLGINARFVHRRMLPAARNRGTASGAQELQLPACGHLRRTLASDRLPRPGPGAARPVSAPVPVSRVAGRRGGGARPGSRMEPRAADSCFLGDVGMCWTPPARGRGRGAGTPGVAFGDGRNISDGLHPGDGGRALLRAGCLGRLGGRSRVEQGPSNSEHL